MLSFLIAYRTMLNDEIWMYLIYLGTKPFYVTLYANFRFFILHKHYKFAKAQKDQTRFRIRNMSQFDSKFNMVIITNCMKDSKMTSLLSNWKPFYKWLREKWSYGRICYNKARQLVLNKREAIPNQIW